MWNINYEELVAALFWQIRLKHPDNVVGNWFSSGCVQFNLIDTGKCVCTCSTTPSLTFDPWEQKNPRRLVADRWKDLLSWSNVEDVDLFQSTIWFSPLHVNWDKEGQNWVTGTGCRWGLAAGTGTCSCLCAWWPVVVLFGPNVISTMNDASCCVFV